MDVEKIIDEKRKELIEEVKKEVKGLEEGIVGDALQKFADFEEMLKMAYSAKVVGPGDILRAIEKNGFVYRGVVDTKQYRYDKMVLHQFFESFVEEEMRVRVSPIELKGKQKVTIIVEPLEGVSKGE